MTLDDLRRRSGLTQAQAGERLNVCQEAVSNWETGKNPPLRKYHKILQRIYDCSPEQLQEAIENTMRRKQHEN